MSINENRIAYCTATKSNMYVSRFPFLSADSVDFNNLIISALNAI